MYVLDASVILALMRDEPGAADIIRFLDGALVSAVNYSEIIQKVVQYTGTIDEARAIVDGLDLQLVAFDDAQAAACAALWPVTRHKGLSLADRACLALAQTVSGIAVTTDAAWTDVNAPGAQVHVIQRPGGR